MIPSHRLVLRRLLARPARFRLVLNLVSATGDRSLRFLALVRIRVVPGISCACRVRSCSRVDRSTRRTNLSSPCSTGRSWQHAMCKASNVGSPLGGVISRTARPMRWIASLSCGDGSAIPSRARHEAPACASASKVSTDSGAYANDSATACAQPVRIVISSIPNARGANTSSLELEKPEFEPLARTW